MLIYMLKQYNGLYNWLQNIDYKIKVIQCNECHLERCLSGKCSNGAIWCVLEHIFLIFSLKNSKNIYISYKNNDHL